MDSLKVKTAAKCPDEVMQAIYGPKSPTKSQDLENSMNHWWRAYSSRKMSNPEEEYGANQMVYNPDHLPGSPTAPKGATPPAK